MISWWAEMVSVGLKPMKTIGLALEQTSRIAQPLHLEPPTATSYYLRYLRLWLIAQGDHTIPQCQSVYMYIRYYIWSSPTKNILYMYGSPVYYAPLLVTGRGPVTFVCVYMYCLPSQFSYLPERQRGTESYGGRHVCPTRDRQFHVVSQVRPSILRMYVLGSLEYYAGDL